MRRFTPSVGHLLLFLLLLQEMSSISSMNFGGKMPSMNFGSKKKSANSKKVISLFNFNGAVIGATNENSKMYEVKIEYDDCKPMVKKTETDEQDGTFFLEVPLSCKTTVEKLTVTATSEGKLGGIQRSNIWDLIRPMSDKQYIFFIGEFEPNHGLFLRGLFTKELPKLDENMAYSLRLTSIDSAKIYGETEIISEEQRKKLSDKKEGAVVKLNRDGLEWVRENERPNMVFGLYKINSAIKCPICQNVFKGGKEPTRQLYNCEHFYHESCLNKSFNRATKNRKNRYKCPLCAKDIALVKQGNAVADQQQGMMERREKDDDENASQHDKAEVVTRELDAEGNVIEKLMKSIEWDELEKVRQQSHQQNATQTTDHKGNFLVYFKDTNAFLMPIFAFKIIRPVLQNGSGRPKFSYKFEPSYNQPEQELSRKMYNQSVKMVDNLNIIFKKKDVVDADFGDSFEDDDEKANEDESHSADEEGDNDPDLHAVQNIPDIDSPPSPAESEEIMAGIRASIDEADGERNSATDHQQYQTEHFGTNAWRTAQAKRIAEQQAELLEQIQRERISAANRSNVGSAFASPSSSWRTNSETDTELTDALTEMVKQQSAMAYSRRNNVQYGQHQTSEAEDEDKGPPLWELLAQSTRSGWTEEQGAEREADEEQMWQHILWNRRRGDGGGWESSSARSPARSSTRSPARSSTRSPAQSSAHSPARSSPARRKPPAPIPRPTYNYERSRLNDENNTNENSVGNEPKEMANGQQQEQNEDEPGIKTAFINLFEDLKKIYFDQSSDGEKKEKSEAKKKFGFTIKFLPELEDKRREQLQVEVKSSLEQFDISVEVNGNEAKVEYANEHPLLFFNIKVWKKTESDGRGTETNNQNLAQFVEERVQIKENADRSGTVYTFYMGAHFHLVINDAESQMPTDAQNVLNYIAQVNCHGERSSGFRSDPKGNSSGNFDVFLPKKHCTEFDIFVGKIHRDKPDELLARASEKGVKIRKGETYKFMKALSIKRKANTKKEEIYENDPILKMEILGALKDEVIRKSQQKVGEEQWEGQKPRKYGEIGPIGTKSEQMEANSDDKEARKNARLIRQIEKLQQKLNKQNKLERRTKLHEKKLEIMGEQSEEIEAIEMRKKEERALRKKIEQKKAAKKIEKNSENESEFETAPEDNDEQQQSEKELDSREKKKREILEKLTKMGENKKMQEEFFSKIIIEQARHSPSAQLPAKAFFEIIHQNKMKAKSGTIGTAASSKTTPKATPSPSSLAPSLSLPSSAVAFDGHEKAAKSDTDSAKNSSNLLEEQKKEEMMKKISRGKGKMMRKGQI